MSARPRAVISTYGVPYSRRAITIYSRGTAHIIAAMTAHDVRRLVCVSSTTVAKDEAPGESLACRMLVVPLLRRVLGRTLYDDMERMERMERLVRDSDFDWTIVRPGGLFDAEEPTADYEIAARRLPGRGTSRADLVEALLREAIDTQHPRSTIEVITRSATPGFANFLKEAFGGT